MHLQTSSALCAIADRQDDVREGGELGQLQMGSASHLRDGLEKMR